MAVMYGLLVTCVNCCVLIYVHCNQYQSPLLQSVLSFIVTCAFRRLYRHYNQYRLC